MRLNNHNYTGIFFKDKTHMTWVYGKPLTFPEGIKVGDKAKVTVIGKYSDNQVECLVVTFANKTKQPQGTVLHITTRAEHESQAVQSGLRATNKGYEKITPYILEGIWKSAKEYKKKANKSSIYRVILSSYDDTNLHEIKVRYKKSTRLDKITIGSMEYENKKGYGPIIFKQIKLNGKQENFTLNNLKDEITIKGLYKIKAEKQVNDTIILIFKDKKSGVRVKQGPDGKYYQKGVLFEPIDPYESKPTNDKFIVYLTDLKPKDGNISDVTTKTEANIVDDSSKIFKKIASTNKLNSAEIYKIKRFISFRSDLSFYYTFIDKFADSIVEKSPAIRYELSAIQENQIDLIVKGYANAIIDDKKNSKGVLNSYSKDTKQIKSDVEKIIYIFKKFRHSLAHFNYPMFDSLFSNTFPTVVDKKYVSALHKIKLLDILLEESENLNVSPKQNYIDDKDTITILDAENIKLKRIYTYFIKLETANPGFNKLINSFLVKDGVENEEIKEYINKRAKEKDLKAYNHLSQNAYHLDIALYRKYKDIYINHKEHVKEKEKYTRALEEERNGTTREALGKKIAALNKEINLLKIDMKEITQINALKRLEYKLRIAFGFLYSQYSENIENIQKYLAKGIRDNTFGTISNDDIKKYLNVSYDQLEENYFYKGKVEKIDTYVFEDLNISLDTVITPKDTFVKTIFLFSIFTPKELRGDFLGFIKMYYHKMMHVQQDTMDKEIEYSNLSEDTHAPQNIKLKILEQNIKKIYAFDYNLYNEVETIEDLNKRTGLTLKKKKKPKIKKGSVPKNLIPLFKDIGIKEEEITDSLLKQFYTTVLQFYKHLYKLISDFEIYLLYISVENNNNKLEVTHSFIELLQDVLKDPEIHTHESFTSLVLVRNDISHQNLTNLFSYFWEKAEPKNILQMTQEIVEKIQSYSDIKKVLSYDCVNDFQQKSKQFKKRLATSYENRSQKIEEKIKEKQTLQLNYKRSKRENEKLENIKKAIQDMNNIQKIKEYILKQL